MSTRMQLLCVVLIGLSLAAATSHLRRPVAQPISAHSGQHFLYCSDCGLEMTCPPELEQTKNFCPHCGNGKRMEVTTYSRNNGEAPPLSTNRVLIATLFGVPAALLIGLYSFSQARKGSTLSSDEDVFRFKCPGCGHAMASNSYRKGSTAVCPVCAELFVVTDPEASKSGTTREDKARDYEDGLRSILRKKSPGKRRKPKR